MMNLLRKAAGWFGGTPAPYFKQPSIYVAPDSYLDNGSSGVLGLSAAWACVNLICGTIASLPLMVYRTDREGGRTVAYRHPLYRILHDTPNFDQTNTDFWEGMTAAVELWGNAYAEIFREGAKVVSLDPIRPDIMTVARNKSTGDLEYTWSDEGKSHKRKGSSILHIRGFGGNPLGGLSTLSYGRHTFGLAGAIERASSATFRNGLRPAGTLTFEKFLTDEQRQVVEAKLSEKFSGAMNSGRPMVLEGGTKWESLSINPEDAQMLQSRAFSVEEICRFFGVPPFMVGHHEKSTSWGTGLEQQTMGFQKFTLRRRLKRIEQALEKQLLTPEDRTKGITIEFVIEGLLRGDSAARAGFYQSGLQNGWMTINEVRGLENLPPVEGGDTPRTQMQNVPITEAGKPPEQVAAPPENDDAPA
jgi:HK97 family phage portal protein